MQVSQRIINKSIDEWRQRLHAVVQNNGAHIEHLRRYNFRRHWYDRSMSLVRNWFCGYIKIHLAWYVNTINWIELTFSSVCARLVCCHCASSPHFFANYLYANYLFAR